MKKLLTCLLFLSSIAFAIPIQDHTIDPIALSELASALGIAPDADLIEETQKQWLRKPDQERWEMMELSSDQKLFVLGWAEEQELFTPWEPTLKTYDKALIFGATTHRMQTRLEHLIELWSQGVRFREIVWLTGDRALDHRVDHLTDRCKTESEAAHIIWNEIIAPASLKTLPTTFIAVPVKFENNFLKRPNTEDTIIAWLATSPEPCKALFALISPFAAISFQSSRQRCLRSLNLTLLEGAQIHQATPLPQRSPWTPLLAGSTPTAIEKALVNGQQAPCYNWEGCPFNYT